MDEIDERFEYTEWSDLRQSHDTVVSFRASQTSFHGHFQSA